jgi:hypothetical protein
MAFMTGSQPVNLGQQILTTLSHACQGKGLSEIPFVESLYRKSLSRLE